MKRMAKIIDISAALSHATPVYPGDPAYRRKEIARIADGSDYTLSRLEMSAHAATHIDMPAHFIAGAKTLDDYPPERFVLGAQVIEITGPIVDAEALDALSDWRGEAILFKTRNSARGLMKTSDYHSDYVGVAADAADMLVKGGAALVGIDYITIDCAENESHPAHLKLLSNECLILEGIDLEGVAPGRYTLICLPLRLSGGEASPVRAVLLEQE